MGYCAPNMRAPVAMSASSMMTASPDCVAFRGTGLHPPAVPTDCGLIGAAQFPAQLHVVGRVGKDKVGASFRQRVHALDAIAFNHLIEFYWVEFH